MIKIVLVEDQQLVREGISTLLQLRPGYQVVATAEDGRIGLDMIQRHQPDLVLLDIRMPVMGGIEVLAALQQQRHHLPVLVLTTFDDHELVRQCIELGAKGYLRKDVGLDELLAAIDTLHAGGEWLQPALTQRIQRYQQSQRNTLSPAVKLTTAEVRVLRLVAAGHSNQEIARALHRAPGTVRNQVSAILEKLEARDRTQAVLRAIDQGLI
ncbi:DNA-binding response regulator [Bacterioplanes sanyensis]|uniref:response regulator transcription factor n=1 Tax=Bacterioplanes sanyensis TaxID=1249553 RepID=UPI00167408CB|nr:response regulator transcription factor [Bacterioplanes sanyensis]GGY52860.1 DNA-binding response regulator [Bacterioplanes sanyensis]